jgi:hypothetical protein
MAVGLLALPVNRPFRCRGDDRIDAEFGWTRMTANRFMNVYEQFKSNNLLHLDIDVSALYLIAAPSTPPPVRLEVGKLSGRRRSDQ